MATWEQIQRRKERERRERAADLAPQFPDIQEVAKLVPEGRELVPGLSLLAGDIEAVQQERQRGIAEAAMPGVSRMFETAGGQVQQMLQGQVPQDVIDRLQSNVAARALSGGVPGSGFAGSQFARTLGLTSLDMIGRGISGMLGITPVAQETFGVPLTDIQADIPGLTDIYYNQLGQELARSQTELALLGLDVSRAGASAAGGVGGGGGGGTTVTYSGMGAPGPQTNPLAGVAPVYTPAQWTSGTRTTPLVGVGGTVMGAPLGTPGNTPYQPGASYEPFPGMSWPTPTGGGSGTIIDASGNVQQLSF